MINVTITLIIEKNPEGLVRKAFEISLKSAHVIDKERKEIKKKSEGPELMHFPDKH
jgi:hypothetical protein